MDLKRHIFRNTRVWTGSSGIRSHFSWQTHVAMITNIQVPWKIWNFLTGCAITSFTRALLHVLSSCYMLACHVLASWSDILYFIYDLISRIYESWLCCQKSCMVQMCLILQAVKYLLHTLSTLCWRPCLSRVTCMWAASGCPTLARPSSSARALWTLYLIASR
jgi:hypothetical protein